MPRRRGARIGLAAVALLIVVLAAGAAALGARQADLDRGGDAGRVTASLAPAGPSDSPPGPSPSTGASASPSASARPAPTPTASPTPSAAPSPSAPDVGQPLDIAELAEQVSAIRGLPVGPPLRARAVTREELAQTVRSRGFGWGDESEAEAASRLLIPLRLIPEGFDLATQGTELYAEQVVGVYALDAETLFVRGAPGALTAYAEFIAAHEVTHALQDRAFDLGDLRDLPADEADASMALLALIEGDAVVTQREWSALHQADSERADLSGEAGSGPSTVLAATPGYLRAALEFPYREGTAFVTALMLQDGYAAVDKAYASPPTTTEQIMHPDRYLAGELASPVPPLGRPLTTFEHSRRATVGQFDLRELLRPLGLARAERVAIGWAGGEVRWWWTGADAAVSLGLVFDTPADAEDACAALPDWYAAVADGQAEPGDPFALRGDRDWMAYRCDEDGVHVGLASSSADARALAGAAAGGQQ